MKKTIYFLLFLCLVVCAGCEEKDAGDIISSMEGFRRGYAI